MPPIPEPPVPPSPLVPPAPPVLLEPPELLEPPKLVVVLPPLEPPLEVVVKLSPPPDPPLVMPVEVPPKAPSVPGPSPASPPAPSVLAVFLLVDVQARLSDATTRETQVVRPMGMTRGYTNAARLTVNALLTRSADVAVRRAFFFASVMGPGAP